MKKTILLLTLMALALLAVIVLDARLTQVEVSAAPPAKRPTPTPMPPPPGWKPPEIEIGPEGFRDQYPDLIVTEITTTLPKPIVGVTETIGVTIKNESTADMPWGTFYVDLYVNPPAPPVQLQRGTISQTAQLYVGGDWCTINFSYVFTQPGGYNLWAQVDTDNHVAESNENNNVRGPVYVFAKTHSVFTDNDHEDFQMGMASNMDLSHSRGVMAGGDFIEPYTEPEIYRPDTMLNSVTGTITSTVSYDNTSWLQVNPSMDADPSGQNVLVAWQDGRYGSVYHNEIYFNWSNNWGASFVGESCVYDGATSYDEGCDQRNPALAYDPWNGNVYIVWQGQYRHNDDCDTDYDIYFSRATAAGGYADWLITLVQVNDDNEPGGAHADQVQPSIAVGTNACDIHVAWVDRRNGNDDVYYSRSTDCGDTWSDPDTFVTDDPEGTKQSQRHPTIGVGQTGTIYVAWEDWREPGHPEIYVTDSTDGGETFDVDVPITIVQSDQNRLDPAMNVEWLTVNVTRTEDETVTVEQADVDIPIVAFQQIDGTGNPDIYLAWTWHSYRPDLISNPECDCCYDFCFSGPIKISGKERACLDPAIPPGRQARPIEPSWQGDVSLTIAPSSTFSCKSPLYGGGASVVWSDARSFDEWRYELYVARVGHPASIDSETGALVIDPTALENPCANTILNDNAKIYYLRDDGARYMEYMPAAVNQRHPAIAVSDLGQIFLAWDDDRWDTPLITGTYRNRDVFFARSGFSAHSSPFPPPTGDRYVYVSRVFSTTVANPEWGVLCWWGATDSLTPIYFQTRTGDNPNPPQDGSATGGWSAWDGTYGSHPGGYYDAPCQPIVSPSNRYIQYKAIIAGPSLCTAISKVTIYYSNSGGGLPNKVFLPIIMKNY